MCDNELVQAVESTKWYIHAMQQPPLPLNPVFDELMKSYNALDTLDKVLSQVSQVAPHFPSSTDIQAKSNIEVPSHRCQHQCARAGAV